jgi:SAM-dependent methyltransferase
MIARLKMLLRALASPPNVLLKRETIEAAAQRHGLLGGRILNVGSKNVRLGQNTVNLDVVSSAGVDVVGDAHELERHFPEKSFDTVVLSAVLQYCENPQRVIQQADYVLKPGGMILLDAPFLQPYCSDGLDLWRFSEDGLRKLCGRYFEIIELKPSIATAPALAFIIQHAASTKKNRLAAAFLGWAATMFVYPFRYVPSSNSGTAGAFLLIGRKLPEQPTSNRLPSVEPASGAHAGSAGAKAVTRNVAGRAIAVIRFSHNPGGGRLPAGISRKVCEQCPYYSWQRAVALQYF